MIEQDNCEITVRYIYRLVKPAVSVRKDGFALRKPNGYSV